MACAALARFVYLLWLGIYVHGLFTDPPVPSNGGTVDLPAVENSTNVSVFCEVSFNNMGNNVLVSTIWRLGSGTETTKLIRYDQPEYSNFYLEDAVRFTNFTILSFTRANLDMMVLECTNGFGGANQENAFFVPRFIG